MRIVLKRDKMKNSFYISRRTRRTDLHLKSAATDSSD